VLLRPCVPYGKILQRVNEPNAIRAVIQAQVAAAAAGAGRGGLDGGAASASARDKDQNVSLGEDVNGSDAKDEAGLGENVLPTHCFIPRFSRFTSTNTVW